MGLTINLFEMCCIFNKINTVTVVAHKLSSHSMKAVDFLLEASFENSMMNQNKELEYKYTVYKA